MTCITHCSIRFYNLYKFHSFWKCICDSSNIIRIQFAGFRTVAHSQAILKFQFFQGFYGLIIIKVSIVTKNSRKFLCLGSFNTNTISARCKAFFNINLWNIRFILNGILYSYTFCCYCYFICTRTKGTKLTGFIRCNDLISNYNIATLWNRKLLRTTIDCNTNIPAINKTNRLGTIP